METGIICRKREQMAICRESEVSEDCLLEVFLENPNQTVYVVRHMAGRGAVDQLVGIITLGDFRRSKKEGRPLINKSFTVCVSKEEAIGVLQAKPKIISVPIVDGQGGILYEYVKEHDPVNSLPYAIYSQICGDIAEECFRKRIVFVGVPEEYREQIEKATLEKENGDRIVFLWDTSFDSLLQMGADDNTVYIDFDEKGYAVREWFYQRYSYRSFFWNDEYKYLDYDGGMEQYLCDRVSYFTDIAVLSPSPDYLAGTSQSNVKKHVLDREQLKWNEDRDCYVYYGELSAQVECLFCRFRVDYIDYIYIQSTGKILPVIDMGVHLRTDRWENEEYDIAYNILPKLMRHGVQCLVVNDPDNEYGEVMDLCRDDIYSRNLENLTEEKLQDIDKILNAGEEKRLDYKRDFLFHPILVQKGWIHYPDRKSTYCNYINGERYTIGNSKDSDKTLYLFGPCIVVGSFVEDACTLGSYLRPMLPEKYYISNCGQVYADLNFSIRNRHYQSGDIVIVFAQHPEIYAQSGITVYSVIEAYQRVGDISENVWDSLKHCNKRITKEIAAELFALCKNNGALKEVTEGEQTVKFGYANHRGSRRIPKQLRNWLSGIRLPGLQKYSDVGAIVMNANPFTKGHRYLIEEALRHVEVLYVFVLEENKSAFSFEDRIAMVRLGTSDLENVFVVPSGRYIVSTATMPGYFKKETAPFVEADAVEDLELFGMIAAELNIKVRFAGEEPIDQFTNQYNESMRRLLPEYGVMFCEIPRKEMGGQVISASRVRRGMKENKIDELEDLVLEPVYEYIINHCLKIDGKE